jgi:hypothetical protein
MTKNDGRFVYVEALMSFDIISVCGHWETIEMIVEEPAARLLITAYGQYALRLHQQVLVKW